MGSRQMHLADRILSIHRGGLGTPENWCLGPALSQQWLGLEVNSPISWSLTSGRAALSCVLHHLPDFPAPRTETLPLTAFTCLICTSYGLPSLLCLTSSWCLPGPPSQLNTHPQSLVAGSASGKLRRRKGWEGGGINFTGARLWPKSLGPRYQARVQGMDLVSGGRSPSSFPKDGDDDGHKGANSGRYHGASSIRHCSHIDGLIQSSQQLCAVGSVIAPLHRGGDWGTRSLSGLPKGGGAVAWQTQAFISLVTSCFKDSERPCGRESGSL